MSGSTEEKKKSQPKQMHSPEGKSPLDHGFVIIGGTPFWVPKQSACKLIQYLDKGMHRGDIILEIPVFSEDYEIQILKTRADCIQGVIE